MGEPKVQTTDTQRIELNVTGLSCGACARRVEKALNKIAGVRASVDLSAGFATVEADRHVSAADLCDAVRKAGYGAEPRVGSADEGDDSDLARQPSLQQAVVAHLAPIARWLISPFHR